MESNNTASLLAQFDDACMRDIDLHGCDHEFFEFVLGQDQCQKKWLEAEKNVQIMYSKINEAKKSTSKLELLNHHVTMLLKDEVRLRSSIQEDIREYHSQFDLVRDCLSSENDLKDEFKEKLHSLSVGRYPRLVASSTTRAVDKMETITEVNSAKADSLTASSDTTSSALSNDDLELSGTVRSYRELRRPNQKFSELMSGIVRTTEDKDSQHSENVTSKTVGDEHDQCIVATTTVSISMQAGTTVTSTTVVSNPSSSRDDFHETTVDRKHRMKRQVIIHQAENCNPCGVRIKFGKPALKCMDCGLNCHVECQVSMPKSCDAKIPENAATKSLEMAPSNK